MRFFTADPHLGHARINELAKRPFKSVEEMNETIISRWNAVVDPEDDVWILGDLALGPIESSLQVVTGLNGTKVLVPGNHDRVHPMMLDKSKPSNVTKFARMVALYESVGLKIVPPTGTLRIADRWVTLSHFPPHGDSQIQGERFPEWRPSVEAATWVLHGHVHGEWLQKGRWINVGMDPWGFVPVSEEQIVELILAGPQDR